MEAVVIEMQKGMGLDAIYLTLNGVYASNRTADKWFCNMTQLCIEYGLVEDEIYTSEAFKTACRNGLRRVTLQLDIRDVTHEYPVSA